MNGACKRQSAKRQGAAASAMALVAIPVLLVIVGLVVYVGLLREAKTESQNGADAAALAAAHELATDDVLTQSLTRAEERIRRARTAALTLSRENFAAGERLQLDPNLSNDPDGDIVFGNLDRPQGGIFRVVSGNPADWVGDQVNAVQITTRRSPVRSPIGGGSDRELRARAVAMIDHRVVGFRPNDDEPIPLMPIGIFTDHTGQISHGWDYHCRRVPQDELRFDYEAKRFVAGPDEIPEVGLILGLRGKDALGVPAVFLQLGVDSFSETINQVRRGVSRAQLEGNYGGGLVLANDNTIGVIGSPECPKLESVGRRLLDAALAELAASGEPRIWPLFSEVDEENSVVRVNGWIAARVASVGRSDGGGIRLVLQPAVVAHRSVVTEARSMPPAFWANNRTVFRVRLAD